MQASVSLTVDQHRLAKELVDAGSYSSISAMLQQAEALRLGQATRSMQQPLSINIAVAGLVIIGTVGDLESSYNR